MINIEEQLTINYEFLHLYGMDLCRKLQKLYEFFIQSPLKIGDEYLLQCGHYLLKVPLHPNAVAANPCIE